MIMKWFVRAVIVVVVASIVAGFFIIGSPQTERMRKIDDQRVADLQNIQWQIVNFWQSKKRFPKDLNELKDDISGWSSPVDPKTQKPYEYFPGEEFSFTLCADFALESDYAQIELPRYPSAGAEENWAHPAGRHCFERTVDPERYPPFEKPAKPI